MFCSTCKRIEIEFNEEVKRKICDNGHILCNICDKNFNSCQICEAQFLNLIYIENINKIPRLQIVPFEEDDSDGEQNLKSQNETHHHNTPADSVKELNEQLKKYDMQCETNANEAGDPPTIGCFQVLTHSKPKYPISYTVSLDGDDEEIIMNHFRVADKSSQKSEKSHKEISKTYQQPEAAPSCGEGDGNSLLVHRPCSSSDFTRTHTPSYSTRSDCIGSDDEFSYVESACEVYQNDKSTIVSSACSNFTALHPSRIELSPPLNIRKLPTIAHRVKFTPVFGCDSRIYPQMEPLGVQCDSDEDESEEKLSLSRMPVTCPISTCGSSSLPSDFYNHMATDHPYINIVKMSPFKVANFTICPAGNLVMCHRMFLVEGKILNIGYGFSENCLPIIIVSTKINLLHMFGTSLRSSKQSDEVFCIWPLSIYEFPLKYSLNVWTHGKDDSEPTLIRCISSTVPYLSAQQTFREIFDNSLVLSKATLEKLTMKDSLISCQIVFH